MRLNMLLPALGAMMLVGSANRALAQSPPTADSIKGHLMNQESVPVAGATVTLRTLEQKPLATAKSDSMGDFILVTPLRESGYLIEFEADGYGGGFYRTKVRGSDGRIPRATMRLRRLAQQPAH